MTDLAIKYVANPFANLFKKIIEFFEATGRARAAAELSRQGYYKEARNIMLGKENNDA